VKQGVLLGALGFVWKVPVWCEYLLAVILSLPYVCLLLFDVHNSIANHIHEILGSSNAANWKSQKKVAELTAQRGMVQKVLWFESQILWISLLRYLVMAFDCTRLSNVHGSAEWKQTIAKQYHYKGDVLVNDEDRSVQCFVGWHLQVAVFGGVLLWLYCWLSIPLLIGLGDCNLVTPTRWLVRCTPFQLIKVLEFRTQRQQWPRYAGFFTRHSTYYYFESALTAAKVMIPTIVLLTTYRPVMRNMINFVLAMLLFFFASFTPPVQARSAALVIVLCCLPLCATLAYRLYFAHIPSG